MGHLALALSILHLELFRVCVGGAHRRFVGLLPRGTEGRALFSEPPHPSRPWRPAGHRFPPWGRPGELGSKAGHRPPALEQGSRAGREGATVLTAAPSTAWARPRCWGRSPPGRGHPAGSLPTRASVSQASSSHEPSTPKPSKVMNRRILQINQGLAVEPWEDPLGCPPLSFVVTRATGAACTGRCTRGGGPARTRCARRPGGTGPYWAHLQGGSASLPRENCPGDQGGRPAPATKTVS